VTVYGLDLLNLSAIKDNSRLNKNIRDLTAKRILFVCYGNTCRSPMAEGLAKKALGESVHVESAGLAPAFDSAAPEAVELMKKNYGVDISHHVPKNVTETPVRTFDRVIVLDGYVFKTIRSLVPDLGDKLLFWDIEDPFGKSMEVYTRAAEKIWDCIQKSLL